MTGSTRFRIALCNEVLADLPFARQCAMAAALGYDGLELAPYTLDEAPHRLPAGQRTGLRRAVTDAGLAVVGLHWLLVTPKGLSITSPDDNVRARTVDVMSGLIDLCADLGGRVLVHGSPQQRAIADGQSPADAWARARACFAAASEVAAAAGVTYCLEPLSRRETAFVNTVAEAVRMVDEVDSPAFRTMLDTSAAGLSERDPIDRLIAHWFPTGKLAHIQLNDRNRRAPGQGGDGFLPVLAALRRVGYAGAVSVEPFVYEPDGPTTAARAIGYLRGLEEALALGAGA